MDINKLDLNLLVTLDTLLAERNVTRAAKRLNLSQPALSARLTRLREILGDQLLLPVQRGMLPTQRALELQAPLHEALESVRRVVAEGASFEASTAQATITIAASDYVQYSVLLQLTAVLRTEAPGIRIVWRTIDASVLMAQMERGEVDLALMTPESAPEQLRMRKLYRERYVAIVRTHHPLVQGSIGLDVFCALDHVVVSPQGGGFSGPTDIALEAIGRRRRVVLSAPAFLIVPEIIARSDMIALVPQCILHDRSDRLQTLEPPLQVPGYDMAMVWHDRTTTHPVQRWLREKIAKLANSVAGVIAETR
ncbi:LysR family transcriptional regulator [Phyllobacterium myrsinacearum]|uniref:DNA-binding transcriptional LysR family regulator n=1 Tax=Phyllobacterium myrsinacearum TaxID=28101 RepID=A0A839ESD3_9HYPH|nr:LysR family transcriptional regulator [Phyllobacterium myrsinacearum]MBA8879520.1 DNA-binding transcriptional LysR family regulator [Phyllobacterium myrsinacearum]